MNGEDLLQTLIEILEKSVEKNGEKPLTNKWLLNILKLADKEIDKIDKFENMSGFDPHWD